MRIRIEQRSGHLLESLEHRETEQEGGGTVKRRREVGPKVLEGAGHLCGGRHWNIPIHIPAPGTPRDSRSWHGFP